MYCVDELAHIGIIFICSCALSLLLPDRPNYTVALLWLLQAMRAVLSALCNTYVSAWNPVGGGYWLSSILCTAIVRAFFFCNNHSIVDAKDTVQY